jgi:4-hydroxybenzoate polyprenyltransferase
LKHSTSLKHFRVNPTVNLSLKQHFTQKVQPIDENITDEKVSPTKYNNWLDKLPPKLAPYVYLTRMDKPIGTWLLYWPCGEFK